MSWTTTYCPAVAVGEVFVPSGKPRSRMPCEVINLQRSRGASGDGPESPSLGVRR